MWGAPVQIVSFYLVRHLNNYGNQTNKGALVHYTLTSRLHTVLTCPEPESEERFISTTVLIVCVPALKNGFHMFASWQIVNVLLIHEEEDAKLWCEPQKSR